MRNQQSSLVAMSSTHTFSDRSNAEFMGSKPIRNMYVCQQFIFLDRSFAVVQCAIQGVFQR